MPPSVHLHAILDLHFVRIEVDPEPIPPLYIVTCFEKQKGKTEKRVQFVHIELDPE